MKVICISGHAQNGKDTVATMIKSQLVEAGSCVAVVHYADALKFICKTFFGWNGVKDAFGRALLQYVGTEVYREQDPNYWVNFMLSALRTVKKEMIWDYVIIADCRFPNEVDCIKNEFPTVYIRVERPGFCSPLTPEQQEHPSETALDDYPADITIINSGTVSDLENQVADLIKEF